MRNGNGEVRAIVRLGRDDPNAVTVQRRGNRVSGATAARDRHDRRNRLGDTLWQQHGLDQTQQFVALGEPDHARAS